jgi:hypothetical protein
LRAEAPLFCAPMTVPAAATAPGVTNAPAVPGMVTTNAPTAAASAK